ncbi:LacI family DNA-binding transcriptional regulator [Pectobacterium parmentieri]|uniref:LacI family transcriptional regulator n=1 Tax=Pectobacterium parmentieri TaxID=1905730 RepID=A0A8B3FHK5_PECPM|nr:LacI family DNA-binding transcriptional regulator [Pectobacterium parmentieri]ACX89356.1 transcriptional regulator, LacI family [Pectobacterium parmentieri WPP163]AOR57405.1 LacI family transcriptional regulator [Pectobacterium parmentieri]AYH11553.1 LacI family transcriptional regulator [Pectobacterium parmentieri]AYH17730.1 LacI family transcriptional regulator [Pectobacterium parmentieri]AYH37833.1 LacI family transcriptional regulator [Pectobacterium parmentieri]
MKTMLEVAKRAGVSKATVSRVLNGTGQVKQSTRDAVFQAMDELGYRPNFLARSLARRTSNSIGLVISNFDGPYFGRLLRRAAEMAESSGKHLIVTDGHDTPEDEKRAVQLLSDRQCDAIILYTRYMSEADLMVLLDTLTIPMMVMNRDLPQARERCIFFRQQQAAFDVVNYLIEQGHREIACITAPMKTPTAQARLAGYQQALLAHQIEVDPRRVAHGTSMVASGYQAARQLLNNGVNFSALFVSNDDMAIGAMKALYEAGKKLPQDVSVFGFDDEPCATYLHPSLSTVYMPIEEMAATAITQVLDLIAGKDIKPLQPFTGELKLRESVQKGPYFTA